MKIPVIIVEGNIGAGKTTPLQKLEQSLSMADKIKIKIDHEPVGAFQTLFDNDMINPLQNCYQNPRELCFRYLSMENGSFVCCGTNLQGYSNGQRFGLLSTFHHLE